MKRGKKRSGAIAPERTNAHLRFRVNGESREVSFAPHKTLLEVLREDLGLTGTKHGCELGECGTCTVLLDGRPILSCLALPVECEGREITTVEGLADGAALHPLQQAFAERDDIPPDRSLAAARAAGFEGDDRIGPYLRSLIQSHHDTLATAVR